VLPFTLLVVLASSISGDQHFFEIVTLSRPSPHQDWGRAKTAGNHFARDDKEPGSSWGKHLPGERPRETAETHVRRKGAAPLSGAEEKTARAISAHAQCACLLSLQMGSINKTRLDKPSFVKRSVCISGSQRSRRTSQEGQAPHPPSPRALKPESRNHIWRGGTLPPG
jgi:hypothetical protein